MIRSSRGDTDVAAFLTNIVSDIILYSNMALIDLHPVAADVIIISVPTLSTSPPIWQMYVSTVVTSLASNDSAYDGGIADDEADEMGEQQLAGHAPLRHRHCSDRRQRPRLPCRVLQAQTSKHVQLLPRFVGPQRHAVGHACHAALHHQGLHR